MELCRRGVLSRGSVALCGLSESFQKFCSLQALAVTGRQWLCGYDSFCFIATGQQLQLFAGFCWHLQLPHCTIALCSGRRRLTLWTILPFARGSCQSLFSFFSGWPYLSPVASNLSFHFPCFGSFLFSWRAARAIFDYANCRARTRLISLCWLAITGNLFLVNYSRCLFLSYSSLKERISHSPFLSSTLQ